MTFFFDLLERFEVSISHLFRPLIPQFSAKVFFQDNKDGEILQPRRILRTERLKGLPSFHASVKVLIGSFQQLALVANHLGKSAIVLRKWWDRVQILIIKKGFLEQQIGADEERVSCKGGNAVVSYPIAYFPSSTGNG